MGQKIHPVGFRVGVIRGHDSHWYYGKKGYGIALLQDYEIRDGALVCTECGPRTALTGSDTKP